MKIIDTILNSITPQLFFSPDFNQTEYANQLIFLDQGGTSEEWEDLKKKNKWKFKKDDTKLFMRYRMEVEPISDKYFSQINRIQDNWSTMYKLNSYTGKRADEFREDCLENIQLYVQMAEIEKKYGQTPPPNAPAFKRLAMLYEKQGDYEKSISVCTKALINGAWGDGMINRLARMIKKAGRKPTSDELALMNKPV